MSSNWKCIATRTLASAMLLMPLSGCVTTKARLTRIPATAVAAIPCRSVAALIFAAPGPGETETSANEFDTPETIPAIRNFNAAYDAACKKEK